MQSKKADIFEIFVRDFEGDMFMVFSNIEASYDQKTVNQILNSKNQAELKNILFYNKL